MKTKYFVFLLLLFIITSCGSYKYRDHYNSNSPKDREQSFYIVDTIDIADPIILKEKGGYFVVSKSVIEKGVKSVKDISRVSDVYAVEFYDYFFFNFLSSKDQERFRRVQLNLYSDTETVIINGESYMKFSAPNVSFVLGLIKTDFYNTMMANSCEEWYMIKERNYKNTYFRIVFPILLNRSERQVVN